MVNERDVYEQGYKTGQKKKYDPYKEELREYAEETSPQQAYNDLFTGEPRNIVQDLREEMPVEYEAAQDGQIADVWDTGAFDALLGRSKNPPTET